MIDVIIIFPLIALLLSIVYLTVSKRKISSSPPLLSKEIQDVQKPVPIEGVESEDMDLILEEVNTKGQEFSIIQNKKDLFQDMCEGLVNYPDLSFLREKISSAPNTWRSLES